mgnify:CR=1 FL=1
MKTALKILKVLAIVVLVLLLVGAGFYFFGSFKPFEPKSLVLSDKTKIEFKVPGSWCGLPPSVLGIKDFPANAVFIKRGTCRIKDATQQVKLSQLLQVQGLLLSEATREQQLIQICANKQGGLSGYQKDGAVYCLGKEYNNIRGITAFKVIEDKYMVTTIYFLLPEIDRTDQLKELEAFVNSYKVVK